MWGFIIQFSTCYDLFISNKVSVPVLTTLKNINQRRDLTFGFGPFILQIFYFRFWRSGILDQCLREFLTECREYKYSLKQEPQFLCDVTEHRAI